MTDPRSAALRYRKRPVVIEAMLLGEFNGGDVATWCGGALRGGPGGGSRNGSVYIKTLEGTMIASPGDYVIRGVQGEFYPCKPDIFEQTYERACDGTVTCTDTIHIHGCYADTGNCDEPEAHDADA